MLTYNLTLLLSAHWNLIKSCVEFVEVLITRFLLLNGVDVTFDHKKTSKYVIAQGEKKLNSSNLLYRFQGLYLTNVKITSDSIELADCI